MCNMQKITRSMLVGLPFQPATPSWISNRHLKHSMSKHKSLVNPAPGLLFCISGDGDPIIPGAQAERLEASLPLPLTPPIQLGAHPNNARFRTGPATGNFSACPPTAVFLTSAARVSSRLMGPSPST